MHNSDLQRITRFLGDQSGLCFSGRRESALRGHLEARVARLGLSGLAQYLDILSSSSSEQDELYQLVTVNETSFFRNRQQFEDLRTVVVPRLEEEKGATGVRRLRVLSAGCSTGEEPYSVAMTLLEGLRFPLVWELEIVAGDLSEGCLRFAAEGRYEEGRLKGIPAGYRDRYLRRDGDGWAVNDGIKALVRFAKLNLARVMAGEGVPGVSDPCGAFDLIFCRNVLIYFPPETQQQLIDTLQKLLAPGGYLLTGDAEPLHLYRHDLQSVPEATSLIYRKAMPLPPLSTAQAPLPPSGVEELLLAVAQGSRGLRDQAMEGLILMGLPFMAPVLEAAVRNNAAADLRNGAMETLVAFGEEALPLLVALLQDPDDEVRNFATVMLGQIGSRKAVPPLIVALRDPDPNVRHGAAEALGKIGDPAACGPLLSLLDQGFWLQFPAIAALGDLGCADAAPRLLELMDDELLFEPVTAALQKIADPRALPKLRAVAEGPESRRARIAASAAASIQGLVGRQPAWQAPQMEEPLQASREGYWR